MKYKLYGDYIGDSTTETILCRRGINKKEIHKWLNAGFNEINSWKLLDDDYSLTNAVKTVERAVLDNKNMLVIVDCDVDGTTSAAIFINYLYRCYPNYIDKISYAIHSGKQHGLSDIIIEDDIDIVIVPDAGSNDYIYHEQLFNRGVPVVILDHHEAEKKSEHAIVVNNQLCNYPNKDLSGAGVVWQFCRAYDELKDFDFANDFIDICALGNLSDMMLFSSIETRAIVNLGLKNIINPFFAGMVEKNEYSISFMGGINYNSIAWYVAPFINAVHRTGNLEEKEIVFKAFCEPWAHKKIKSQKRRAFGNEVKLWEEAVRIACNVKTSKQGKLQDEGLAKIESIIKNNDLLNDSVLVCCCEPGDCEPELRGLVANKLQAKYQRPALVLTHCWDKDRKEYIYAGSSRNFGMSEIKNFKDIVNDSGYAIYAEGHQGSFGCAVSEYNIHNFVSWLNNYYLNVPKEPVYYVDYAWTEKTIDKYAIMEIGNLSDCWGQGCPEPYVIVEDIDLAACPIELIGKRQDTVKIISPYGIEFIKFRTNKDFYDSLKAKNSYLTVIGRCGINRFNGKETPQIKIDEYEINTKWIF